MRATLLTAALVLLTVPGLARADRDDPTLPPLVRPQPERVTPRPAGSQDTAVSASEDLPRNHADVFESSAPTPPRRPRPPEESGTGGSGLPDRSARDLTVLAGVGVEGYAGSLNASIKPGPAWSVTAAVKPTRAVGFEVGYTGAINETREATVGESAAGPDIVRNGGNLSATLGLPTQVQPYLLGGIGFNVFTVRGRAGSGLHSDSAANLPLGGGVRTRFGPLVADARVSYHLGLGEQFAAAQNTRSVLGVQAGTAGRYDGMIGLGAAF